MRKLIILASLLVCCVAAPTSQQSSHEHKGDSVLLQRPSPINPDVPSDPKPHEKIIKITDPKEIIKHKREAQDDPYDHISRFAPTVHPASQVGKDESPESDQKHSKETDSIHRRQKRGKEQGRDTIKSAHKPALKKENPKHSRSSNVQTPAPARDLPKSRQRRQVDPHLIGASTAGVTPLIYDEDKKPHDAEAQPEITPEEQATPTLEPNTHEIAPVKRDIPVPLVPKYHHPEESPKSEAIDDYKVDVKKNEQEKPDEHRPKDDDSESSESSESDEDSKETASQTSTQNSQQIHQELHSQLHESHIPPTAEVHTEKLDIKPAADVQPAQQQHQSNDKTEEPVSPIEAPNHTPGLDQLASVKPTQIIAYESPANESDIAIKHPVPVAELFSRPKQ
ncbi:neurofilament heavy polypeptide [Anastrepha ludens]|uniref:neurofilament heavy polypeptide n=1 Tax=Anastrepha ludens TaxID=28586 RepID=UPI0023B169EE|nr:neurofilament heavy polypeptide [Anastrepha ludens]